MLDFVSRAGAEVLADLQVGNAPPPTGGRPPVELLACVPSDECGCPEEVWRIDGIDALIHFEADGSSEAFLFAGDWEAERHFTCATMAALRAELFAWVATITGEGKSG